MKFKVGSAGVILLLFCLYLYLNKTKIVEVPQPVVLSAATTAQVPVASETESSLLTLEEVREIALSKNKQAGNTQRDFSQVIPKTTDQSASGDYPGFEFEDGVAVIEGDIVLGEPRPGQKYQGFTQPLMLWPNGVVPFFIQGDVENPTRIIQAMAEFVDSGISFVPYIDQEDVLVFQNGTGNCKSYVGRIGGKQPLWVAPGCGTKEITHEIMHALGFIHEQNRNDRDAFIDIQWANIDENAKVNFEKFPIEMMKANGLGAFDYQSLMLYPPSMYSKNGETMRSLQQGKSISPSYSLSTGDLLRLNQLSKKE
ncbi:M12 family metallopeptidase [Bdellovibrio sp. GT3]|uniref:M12 family metallopeptidase n=1 Tax=Bdellovibrio sp. GT3 TaxID=3136282 RepID=UPI0030F22343